MHFTLRPGFFLWTDDELRQRSANNSKAWFSADGPGRIQLHDENVGINRELDRRRGETTTFDPDSGIWSERKETSAQPKAGGPGTARPTEEVGAPSRRAPQAASHPTSGEFTYQSAPEYVNKYQGLVDSLVKDVLNREDFEYDPESDPNYQQYKESYTRNGQRAMEDTLGQVSARTGGLASSYAGSAAQQTYDGYMAQLSDKVPQLRQLAYQMYLDEENRDRANLEMLMGLEQGDYNKYLAQLGQYNADRSMDFDIYRGQVGDNQWQQSFDFQQDQEAYRRDQDERDWQYQTDSGKAALLYTAGDPSGYAALWGLTPEETQLLVDNYAEQKQLTQDAAARELAEFHARYGDFSKLKEIGVDTTMMEKSAAGGNGGGTGGEPKLTADQAEEALKKGIVNEETLAAYRYWYGEDWENEMGPVTLAEPMTKSEFDSFLNSFGRQYADTSTTKAVAKKIWELYESGRLTKEQYEKATKVLGFAE